jgi:hypothetical protein
MDWRKDLALWVRDGYFTRVINPGDSWREDQVIGLIHETLNKNHSVYVIIEDLGT